MLQTTLCLRPCMHMHNTGVSLTMRRHFRLWPSNADAFPFVFFFQRGCGRDSSFILSPAATATRRALCNTRLISNSFLEPLHNNYQRRVWGKVSLMGSRRALSPAVHHGIFQIKRKPFPLGISSTAPAVAPRSAARPTLLKISRPTWL